MQALARTIGWVIVAAFAMMKGLRARQRQTNLTLLTIFYVLLITTGVFASSSEIESSSVTERFEQIALEITKILLLLLLCLRILFIDIFHFLTEIKYYNKKHTDRGNSIQANESNTDTKRARAP